jgi:hypothetical protein
MVQFSSCARIIKGTFSIPRHKNFKQQVSSQGKNKDD